MASSLSKPEALQTIFSFEGLLHHTHTHTHTHVSAVMECLRLCLPRNALFQLNSWRVFPLFCLYVCFDISKTLSSCLLSCIASDWKSPIFLTRCPCVSVCLWCICLSLPASGVVSLALASVVCLWYTCFLVFNATWPSLMSVSYTHLTLPTTTRV